MPTKFKSRGFLRRSLDAFLAAREREAQRYINRALLGLDDETLASRGYDRRELERRINGNL